MQPTCKHYNKSKSEFINELPENVYEVKSYVGLIQTSLFDRYWWDPLKCRLIMKPLRGKRFKIIHPMIKHDGTRFVHMLDINGDKIFVNYDYFEFSNSIGYYLNDDYYR